MDRKLYNEALKYHQENRPGKLEIQATKPLDTQFDLSLAYTPGVAAPCEEIHLDSKKAALYTNRPNTVAVISNGTAVLGLGDIGALASKPVMEGKAVLFKKFAGIDAIDIEINENDPYKLADIIASLEPSFGAINLEDIKAPDCFIVEKILKEKMSIPVFHDDQHGTAVIVVAALINALDLVNKKISEIKLVTSGAGAAAIACLKLLISMGLKNENVIMTDSKGVVSTKRQNLDSSKLEFVCDEDIETLSQAIKGADVFLGVSRRDILTTEMLNNMAATPIVFALANPYPEINPQTAKEIRPDAIICSGRSDYPNQVNNVLCFPFIFRGALDVGATCINTEMKIACVEALAELAKLETSGIVASAYNVDKFTFGKEYIIPKPFDPRLLFYIAPMVAKAAMDCNVATMPIEDWDNYYHKLSGYMNNNSNEIKIILNIAKQKFINNFYPVNNN